MEEVAAAVDVEERLQEEGVKDKIDNNGNEESNQHEDGGLTDDPESESETQKDNSEESQKIEDTNTNNLFSNSDTKTSINDGNAVYVNDHSLRIPISSVRFRGSQLHIIDTDIDQLILQQQLGSNGKDSKTTLVKRLSPITYAQRSLRIGYSLITIIFAGFLFVFCCQVLLFVAIALPVNADEAWSIPQLAIISTLLSIPVLLYGLTSLMTMVCAFVRDTYRGGVLFKSTVIEIIYMM